MRLPGDGATIVFGAFDRAADSSHREGDLGSFSLHREVSLLGRGRTFVDGVRATEQAIAMRNANSVSRNGGANRAKPPSSTASRGHLRVELMTECGGPVNPFLPACAGPRVEESRDEERR